MKNHNNIHDINISDNTSKESDKKAGINKKKTAVALSYNLDDAAPKIIATGKGHMADKIIQEANKEDIPIHKDENLAHTLSRLELGSYIPPELYEVVAEILVFVDKMDQLKSKLS